MDRQFDEVEAVEAITGVPVEWCTPQSDIEALRAGSFDGRHQPLLEFIVSVPIGEGDCEPCRLQVKLPSGYPADTMLTVVSCTWQALRTRALSDALMASVSEFVASSSIGEEILFDVVQHVTDAAQGFLDKQTAADDERVAQAAAGRRSAKPVGAPCRQWLWCDHLLFGKQHAKERELVAILQAAPLSGRVWFGKPGIVVLEGDASEIDAAVRECGRRAGKSLKVRKSQALAAGSPAPGRDGSPAGTQTQQQPWAHFPAKVDVCHAAGGADSAALDTAALQAELSSLGLEDKFRLIIGLDEGGAGAPG